MRVVGRILIGIVAMIVVWAVSLPFVIGALDQDLAAREEARPALPISLAIGGEGCGATPSPTRFTTTDRIRLISDRTPGGEDARAQILGLDVMIELFPLPHDTAHPAPSGYPAHRHFEATAACISEELPPLSSGEYEAWVHVGESRAYIDFLVVAP